MSNRNARIVTKRNKTKYGKQTFTKGRDTNALKVTAKTTTKNATEVLIFRNEGEQFFILSGSEARTLQRALNSHYGHTEAEYDQFY